MNHTLRSRQLNPCDHLFWKSRGYPERPHNWKQILEESGYYDNGSDDDYSEEEYSAESEYDTDDEEYSDDETDEEYEENRLKSLQNNPNNDEYWRLRGLFPRRPNDWKERVYGTSTPQTSSNTKNEWWKYGKNRIY